MHSHTNIYCHTGNIPQNEDTCAAGMKKAPNAFHRLTDDTCWVILKIKNNSALIKNRAGIPGSQPILYIFY